MNKDGKEKLIIIRIEKYRKENWKNLCVKKNISLTSLIINSVENRILDDERRKVIMFIEKQDNLFAKIENNINQVAKIANSQKFISKTEFDEFRNELKIISKLKEKQNEMFKKIYTMLAK